MVEGFAERRNFMTANQINFAVHQETQRHNLETEAQGRTSLQETARHNRSSEAIGWGNVGVGYAGVAESHRHNVATEGINWFTAQSLSQLQGAQTGREEAQIDYLHSQVSRNQLQNVLGVYTAVTTQAETRRHNKATENAANIQAEASQRNAETRRDLATSEKFRNYASGIGSAISGLARGVDTVVNLIPGSNTGVMSAYEFPPFPNEYQGG